MKALARHLHALARRVVVLLVPHRQDRAIVVQARQAAVLVHRQAGQARQAVVLAHLVVVLDQAIAVLVLRQTRVALALRQVVQGLAPDHLAHLAEDN